MSDSLHRFLFERHPVRGELVQLDATWRAVLERRDYPAPIRRVLGEAMAAAALLSATIKFEGALTLQLQAPEGALRLLVVQVTSERTVRGLARWDEGAELADAPLAELCGHGTLVITIEQGPGREPYQGMVVLDGPDFAAALETYFERSEQLPTRLWLAADGERAAGLLLQRLPGEAADADAWSRFTQLAATLEAGELLRLPPATVLHRLFHEEDVRLFDAEPIAFRCTCSRERARGMLRALKAEDVREMLATQGCLTVDCGFCGQRYVFDAVDTEGLLVAAVPPDVPSTKH